MEKHRLSCDTQTWTYRHTLWRLHQTPACSLTHPQKLTNTNMDSQTQKHTHTQIQGKKYTLRTPDTERNTPSNINTHTQRNKHAQSQTQKWPHAFTNNTRLKLRHTQSKTHYRNLTGTYSYTHTHTHTHAHTHTQQQTNTHQWTDSSSHFYVRPGFIIVSLIEWLAASCPCSYISMHYGRDKTPFTWREQQHRAEQVWQSLDVSQPGRKHGDSVRKGRRVKWILKPFCKYWEAGNEICLEVLIRNGDSGGGWTLYITCRRWEEIQSVINGRFVI